MLRHLVFHFSYAKYTCRKCIFHHWASGFHRSEEEMVTGKLTDQPPPSWATNIEIVLVMQARYVLSGAVCATKIIQALALYINPHFPTA